MNLGEPAAVQTRVCDCRCCQACGISLNSSPSVHAISQVHVTREPKGASQSHTDQGCLQTTTLDVQPKICPGQGTCHSQGSCIPQFRRSSQHSLRFATGGMAFGSQTSTLRSDSTGKRSTWLDLSDFKHLQAVNTRYPETKPQDLHLLQTCASIHMIHQKEISWRMLKVSPDKPPWSGAWDTAAACRLTRVWTLTMIQHSEMRAASLSPRNVFRRVCTLQNIGAASQWARYMEIVSARICQLQTACKYFYVSSYALMFSFKNFLSFGITTTLVKFH